jgi:hypothetical protein
VAHAVANSSVQKGQDPPTLRVPGEKSKGVSSSRLPQAGRENRVCGQRFETSANLRLYFMSLDHTLLDFISL